MLLDIIIPQYKETEEDIKPLLDSIDNQKNIDFSNISLTIVNDKSDVLLSKRFLRRYKKLKIKYLINDKNTGPGLARQKGIDNTSGDYIMFIDSDDTLASDNVLYVILDFIFKHEPKYLVTDIKTEIIKDDKIDTITKKAKDTFPWMHGKVYQRRFLEEYNIRFHPDIRHLEDTYFTDSILSVIDRKDINYLDFETVLWKFNKKSLTRKDKKYHYSVRTFDDFYKTAFYVYDFMCEHKSKMRFSFFVSSMFGIYILLNSDIFKLDELEEMKNKYLLKLKEDINKKKNLFVLFNEEDLIGLYKNEERELIIRQNLAKIDGSFEDFKNNYLN
ncbi:MAG: glycosyltransferase family 2 protein [Acholeplasmatales bacterium]|nr:glycosyltransferase family 2 protein [Acholeplasmatales bacterium]